MQKGGGHRPEWKVVKEFRDGGFGVDISMSGGFKPHFSARFGGVRPDGSLSQFIPLEVEGVYKISLKQSLTGALKSLLEQAEQWVLEEAALRVDELLEKRIEKETRDANAGKGQTRVTGKTAKKKARMKAA